MLILLTTLTSQDRHVEK